MGKLVPTQGGSRVALGMWGRKGHALGHWVRGAIGFLEEMLLNFLYAIG